MSARAVLDASALLALLYREPGAEIVEPLLLSAAAVSAVNYTEVAAKLIRRGAPAGRVIEGLRALRLRIVPWDQSMAEHGTDLSALGWTHHLSLGDRACLATARDLQVPAFTADRAWAALQLPGIVIQVIR